ncbi:MAG TPA: DsrE family protein [Pseudolabrys sp.]
MRRMMIFALGLMAGLALAFAVSRGQAHDADQIAASAPEKNPLFINMTTGDSWRGWMGLHFAHATLKQGHPVAIFLNLDAVKLAAKTGEQEMKPSMQRPPREIIADFIKDGGVVLMCGPCMAEFGLKTEDLVPGVQMGRPGYTQSFIFAENARTLTW